MAFNYLNLEFISGNSVREWKYKTTDTLATVLTSGYFNTAGDSWFDIGDLIKVQIVDNLISSLATTVINVTIEITAVT